MVDDYTASSGPVALVEPEETLPLCNYAKSTPIIAVTESVTFHGQADSDELQRGGQGQ